VSGPPDIVTRMRLVHGAECWTAEVSTGSGERATAGGPTEAEAIRSLCILVASISHSRARTILHLDCALDRARRLLTEVSEQLQAATGPRAPGQ